MPMVGLAPRTRGEVEMLKKGWSEQEMTAYQFGTKKRGFWAGRRVRTLIGVESTQDGQIAVSLAQGGNGYLVNPDDVDWICTELECSCGAGEDCRLCQDKKKAAEFTPVVCGDCPIRARAHGSSDCEGCEAR